MDRGPDSAQCVEIAIKVESVLGWTVLILHGNHELMRAARVGPQYMHPRDFETVGGSKEAAMGSMRDMVTSKLYDRGLLMVRLSSPTPMAVDDPRNPSTLFVHAGIDLDWLLAVTESRYVNQINQLFNDQIKVDSSLKHWHTPKSPVWLRDYDPRWGNIPTTCGYRLTAVLSHFNVARIVVGHLPQYQGVRSLCEGRILLTDVSMSRWMTPDHDDSLSDGNPAAVIIQMGTDDGLLDSITAHFDNLLGSSPNAQAIFPPPPPKPYIFEDSGLECEP